MASVTLLRNELWEVPRNEIIRAETLEIFEENRRHLIPGFSVLVKDKEMGNILWDTGINADWDREWNDKFKQNYIFKELYSLDEKLQKW